MELISNILEVEFAVFEGVGVLFVFLLCGCFFSVCLCVLFVCFVLPRIKCLSRCILTII